MRRAALLAVLGSVLLGAFAGVAWAAEVFCSTQSGGPCQGTEQFDFMVGTAQSDQIFALGSPDDVFALGGADQLNGQNGGDELHGGNGPDTYNGGNGPDFLDEFSSFPDQPTTNSGSDVMNGGEGTDRIQANTGDDILRGQNGDECGEGGALLGDEGNDRLFGGNGEDCLFGEEGTDEHFGGADNDFIDAVDNDPETGQPLGTQDVVDCGGGFDTAFVIPEEDIVRTNCEDIVEPPPPVAQPTSSGTTD